MKTHEELIRDTWPEWSMEEEIGCGAYGTVYKARKDHIAGTSYAAIKVIVIPGERDPSDEFTGNADDSGVQSEAYLKGIVQDFAHEISLMESVKGHTNIVGIEDYRISRIPGELKWVILIRMELLTPLVEHIALHPMSEEDVIQLGMDICTALTVCRRFHIIHRDIKPENICINSTGDYKLGDFGEARILDPLSLNLTRKGTPNYMAAELYHQTAQLDREDSGTRIDIYSLGLVLYWLMNQQRLPFLPDRMLTPQDRLEAFQRRVRGEPLPPPSHASQALSEVILRACAYQPEDRYPSAEDMKHDLEGILRGDKREESGRPGGKKPRDSSGKARRRWIILLILLIALIAAGLIARYFPPDPVPLRETESSDELPGAEGIDDIYDVFINSQSEENRDAEE